MCDGVHRILCIGSGFPIGAKPLQGMPKKQGWNPEPGLLVKDLELRLRRYH